MKLYKLLILALLWFAIVWSCSARYNTTIEKDTMNVINIFRELDWTHELKMDSDLNQVAYNKCRFLHKYNLFEHNPMGINYINFFYAVNDDFRYYRKSENLSRNSRTAANTAVAWYNSLPHRKAMLDWLFRRAWLAKYKNYRCLEFSG